MSEAVGGNKVQDQIEVNDEKYDMFDAKTLPRTLSKSPISDEGIETDSERRRSTRCCSIDSTIPSDDDIIMVKKNKLKVTRCYSSDSAVISDDDQGKGWDCVNAGDNGDCETNEEMRRCLRTPSVVVSDYSDYSFLEERLDRSDWELDIRNSGTPSQASSCSCISCDEHRDFCDISTLQVCLDRRHSDSCCINTANSSRQVSDTEARRNSCLATTTVLYSKSNIDCKENLLDVPPVRKISDCSTNSSLSGDDVEVTELQLLRRPQTSGWRKLRNIVHWTPFFQTYKKQRYPWVQLAGHQGNFQAGPTPGTILKRLCPQELACFELLMNDVLRPYVPEFRGVRQLREFEGGKLVLHDENNETESSEGQLVPYLELQDLLCDFNEPCVMDCKIGVRTYLESELAKAKERPKLRKDMYEKMIQVDPTAPSLEERNLKGVTKPRYMVWRETISSTATLGFRVEGMKTANGGSTKDFKTTRTREQVTAALRDFFHGYPHVVPRYLQRLKAIKATLLASPFFQTHEVIGSSLLFVHDSKDASIWLIDFAKTLPVPSHLTLKHDVDWNVGNHEDGYLIGVKNLIKIIEDILKTS